MKFEEAVRIVEKSMTERENLTFDEIMEFPLASSMLAVEYVKVRERIMPA